MEHKSILITGVAGFIASNLACGLVLKYPDVDFVGIDKMTYCSSISNLQEVIYQPNFTFLKLDLSNKAQVDHLFDKYTFDAILHLAAYSHVDMSFTEPLTYTYNNVLGTHNLIESARTANLSLFVHMSTDEVYGTSSGESNEESILNPTNPYSGSKAAADMMVISYIESFKFPAIIIRCNNIYGPKQYPEKVISKSFQRLIQGKKCHIQGSGEQVRSFVYVDDVVKLFDLLLHTSIRGEIYNTSSPYEVSIIDLVKAMIKIHDPKAVYEDHIKFTTDRPYNDLHYRIDSSKLERDIGFKVSTSLDVGLVQTYQYILKHQ